MKTAERKKLNGQISINQVLALFSSVGTNLDFLTVKRRDFL